MEPLTMAIVVGLIQGGRMLNEYFEKKDAERRAKNSTPTASNLPTVTSSNVVKCEAKPDHVAK